MFPPRASDKIHFTCKGDLDSADTVEVMDTELARGVESLLGEVTEELSSLDAEQRVAAVHLLVERFQLVERATVAQANLQGVSWTTIGNLYGVSRQAVHQRFSGATFVPSQLFDSLIDDQDDDEPIPALAEAIGRALGAVKAREGVPN